MIERLQKIKERFAVLEKQLADPNIIADTKRYAEVHKEYKRLQPVVETIKIYEDLLERRQEAKNILQNESDDELQQLAQEELKTIEQQLPEVELQLKRLLLPRDPNEGKPVILEIRAGTGGDEAALFAGDLLRMYQRYAERKGWDFTITSYHEGSVGGFKEVIARIQGDEAYSRLKYEAGVHRVQRIPKTESQGRIHTSAATVAVLPEPDEVDIHIDPKDIKKEVFCASGPGGQHVNRTQSAVRLTHIPTGIVVSMQNERSQIRNYEMAMKILRARIYELEMRKRKEEESKMRSQMVSTGDRSAKIRTYNFPQSRVTDHRIGLTLYNLPDILDGNLDPLIDALILHDQTQQLAALEK